MFEIRKHEWIMCKAALKNIRSLSSSKSHNIDIRERGSKQLCKMTLLSISLKLQKVKFIGKDKPAK